LNFPDKDNVFVMKTITPKSNNVNQNALTKRTAVFKSKFPTPPTVEFLSATVCGATVDILVAERAITTTAVIRLTENGLERARLRRLLRYT